MLECLFYVCFKFSNNIIFENRFETENRYFVSRGVLKSKFIPRLRVAIFGGSSANGYGSTISFSEILNNMSILSKADIIFDNHATPATPFYLYQAEKIKRLINNYDIFVVYAGHNEWLHFNHDKKFFPNNTKTTDYKLSKQYWSELLEEEIKISKDNNFYHSGGNLIFNSFTDKIRILNFSFRSFNKLKVFFVKNYYKYFVKQKEKNINKIRYFYDEKFFNNSDYKSIWVENFKQSIFEIEKILPDGKRLILINPLPNLLTPPVGDFNDISDENNEKQIANAYKNLANREPAEPGEFEKIKDGAHKNYLLGLYCLEKLLEANNYNCINLLNRSKQFDEMPWTIIRPIKYFITKEAEKISKKIEVINISDFEKNLIKDQKNYQSFFLDYVHPSKYGHSYLANKISNIIFNEEIESKLVFNSKTPQCPSIEYYVEKKLEKTIATSKRQCDKKFNLIKNWHKEFRRFTKSDTHFIYDQYFDKDKF